MIVDDSKDAVVLYNRGSGRGDTAKSPAAAIHAIIPLQHTTAGSGHTTYIIKLGYSSGCQYRLARTEYVASDEDRMRSSQASTLH